MKTFTVVLLAPSMTINSNIPSQWVSLVRVFHHLLILLVILFCFVSPLNNFIFGFVLFCALCLIPKKLFSVVLTCFVVCHFLFICRSYKIDFNTVSYKGDCNMFFTVFKMAKNSRRPFADLFFHIYHSSFTYIWLVK